MLKIFVQNKPLFLVDFITKEVEDYLHRSDTIFIDEFNPAAVRTILQQLESPEIYTGVFQHSDLNELLNGFKSQLTLIQAAGGLVRTRDNKVLLIFRKGKWDLPKGKLDEGEDLEACAIREIEDETGAINLKLESPLCITYHTYYEKEKHVLKESHWYTVNAAAASSLHAQAEEDIEKCEWVALNHVEDYTANMHASIIDVIRLGLKTIKEKEG